MNFKEKYIFQIFLTEQASRYDKTLTPEKIELYWKYLQNYSLEEIKRAFEVNAQDEKFIKWPTVVVLEVIIKKQLSQRGHRNLYSCQMDSFETENKTCGKPAMVNIRTVEDPFFICSDHYEIHTKKSEIGKEISVRNVEFERKAAELGMTGRQYFFHLRGRSETSPNQKEIEEIENREILEKIFQSYLGRAPKTKSYGGTFDYRT